jgi:hypothetical protein
VAGLIQHMLLLLQLCSRHSMRAGPMLSMHVCVPTPHPHPHPTPDPPAAAAALPTAPQHVAGPPAQHALHWLQAPPAPAAAAPAAPAPARPAALLQRWLHAAQRLLQGQPGGVGPTHGGHKWLNARPTQRPALGSRRAGGPARVLTLRHSQGEKQQEMVSRRAAGWGRGRRTAKHSRRVAALLQPAGAVLQPQACASPRCDQQHSSAASQRREDKLKIWDWNCPHPCIPPAATCPSFLPSHATCLLAHSTPCLRPPSSPLHSLLHSKVQLAAQGPPFALPTTPTHRYTAACCWPPASAAPAA